MDRPKLKKISRNVWRLESSQPKRYLLDINTEYFSWILFLVNLKKTVSRWQYNFWGSENDLKNENFEEKNYTTLISTKTTTNFVLTTFLLRRILCSTSHYRDSVLLNILDWAPFSYAPFLSLALTWKHGSRNFPLQVEQYTLMNSLWG